MDTNNIIKLIETIEKQSSIIKELIRHRISAILMDTDEEHPLECFIPFGDSYGLSALQLPTIIKAYQIPTEGIIYFIIEGYDKPIEFDDEIFNLSDLALILKLLEQ